MTKVNESLVFNATNEPTRTGELVATQSDIQNIPSPRVGMIVYVQDEKKNYIVLTLKEKEVSGVKYPDAQVDEYEGLDAALVRLLTGGEIMVGLAEKVKDGGIQLAMLSDYLKTRVNIADSLDVVDPERPLSARQGVVLKESIDKNFQSIKNLMENAPDNFDTLVEIANWITSHGEQAANMILQLNALAEEISREEGARIASDDDIKGKGVLFGGFGTNQTTADKVVIGYQDIAQKTTGAIEIPAATTENAGVMSAEDKRALDHVKNIKPVVYEGSTITNAPDNEDLTVVDNVLKLKDRQPVDGMGYVILRKGKSFAEQVTEVNTIYEIRYDFSLASESTDVAIPQKSVLRFNGGSISGGTIVASGVRIAAPKYHIFKSVEIKGTFDGEGYPEWFGADVMLDDNRAAIQQAINAFKQVCLEGCYKLSTANHGVCIDIPSGHGLIGRAIGTIDSTNVGLEARVAAGEVVRLHSGSRMENVHIKGAYSDNTLVGISSENTHSIVLSNLILSNLDYGIRMNTFLTSISRVECWYNNVGFYFEGKANNPYTSVAMSNCYAAYNKNNGYVFDKMIYTTLNCCACDSSGRRVIDGELVNTSAVGYAVTDSQNISLINCGAEQNARLLYVNNSVNINLESCNVQAVVDGLVVDKFIDIRFSTLVNINNCGISLTQNNEGEYVRYTGKYVYIDSVQNIIVLRSNSITQDALTLYNEGVTDVDIYNSVELNYDNVHSRVTTTPLKNYQDGIVNVTVDAEYVCEFTAPTSKYLRDTEFLDYTRSALLTICGTAEVPYSNRIQLDANKPMLFKGWRKVVFKNILFEASSQWDGTSSYMRFFNTEVEFVNCIFWLKGGEKLFSNDNAIIRWKNTYEYTYGSARRNNNNVIASFNFDVLLKYTDYNTASRVILPVGSSVTINNVQAIVVSENNNLICDSNELKLIDNSGTSLQKKGVLENRPDAINLFVPVGYMYMWEKIEPDDITGGQTPTGEVIPIWWNGSDWQDANGNFVASGTIRDDE